ncbi:acyltransferase family protein [Duganella levis]|uniref:Acyltransferase family protein n=1 Tax=Duganella levis TaxID=2692169 RepID=A0ABW9W564_9BURK|nr:acyltransferase family protein [Duganella levis]MYN29091.1 acyltransferase family protein [Duganella levis]
MTNLYSSHQTYRPDIDGLRALAVLPVVLFHFGFPGFFGGFIGVDVFFVISGYLITGILARELRQGNFSIVRFYRRRAIRIFPALFVMLAATTVLALFSMLPEELKSFGHSLLATSTFLSNILFYNESGYFSADAHTKVLLHTWSLAVEEQFYLFWPLVLALLHARAKSSVGWIAGIITVASLLFSIWWLSVDPSGAFYLIPSRAWELMIGALLAVAPALPARHRLLREFLAAAGVLAILIGVKFYNERVPFPGVAALLPCLGAAAIIAAGTAGTTLAGRVLSWRPVVFIGQISFSLYLWHWPVVVFTQIGLMREITWPIRIAQVLLSLLLAVLSWRYVEQPVRVGTNGYSDKKVFGGAFAAMAATLILGVTFTVSGGLPARYNEQQLAVAKFESYHGDQLYRGGTCFIVDGQGRFDPQLCLGQNQQQLKSLLVIGDSHAAQLWPGLHQVATDYNVLQATKTGCRPSLSGKAIEQQSSCEQFFRSILTSWLPAHPVQLLILAGRWAPEDLPDLTATIALAKRYAQTVMVVGPIPQYASSLPRVLVRNEGHPDRIASSVVNGPFILDPQMRGLVTAAGAHYFSLIDNLCHGRACRTLAAAGVPMQFDYGHLTEQGSVVVASMLLNPAQSVAKSAVVGMR